VVVALAVSVRPRQWTKNLFVFAGLIFSQKLFTPDAGRAVAAFAIFCALSGVIYLLNDVADRERDRAHPRKRLRPIASGALPVPVAVTAALVLAAVSLTASAMPEHASSCPAATYVVLLALYSVALKHIVIVDVLTVASGFVLRAVAGALAVDVEISGWLLICHDPDRAVPGAQASGTARIPHARRGGGTPSSRARRVQRGAPRPDDSRW
jgi:4-hydroxybenzoate polyprenyltransferase